MRTGTMATLSDPSVIPVLGDNKAVATPFMVSGKLTPSASVARAQLLRNDYTKCNGEGRPPSSGDT